MGEPGGQSRPRRFTFSDAPNEASGASAPAAPRVVAPQAQAPAAVPPRLGFATPSQPRPQHVPAMHHSAWSQQQNWPGWGGGDGWGYEGYEGYGGDGWGGWDDPALWNACAAWHGKGGCGGYPAGSMGGQILVGTVKSYSSVKGFGFLIHSDIAQDIWFAKETVAAEYRTSDLAGTSMSFELIRAQDGKPQARNLRPAPSGMPPPPVNPNQHVPVSRFDQRPGFPPPALMRPGMPGMMPGMAGMPGMGVGVGMGVGMAMGMRPAGMPGMAAPGQPKRRAWSPHAGSRAIATASKDDQAGELGLRRSVKENRNVYITINIKDVRYNKTYHLEAPEAGQCSHLKCNAGAEQCTFRQPVASPITLALISTHYFERSRQEHLPELKQMLIDHTRRMPLFQSEAATRARQKEDVTDLDGPYVVEPSGVTESWKYFYAWNVETEAIAENYVLDGCRLNVARGKFKRNSHFKKK
ncbi:unnamed protein product [Effrenium voratum]|nr:unnamed protein product [Effrenium voratum]